MRVAVLSDTHAPRRWTSCPPAVAAHLGDVDVILHAGDVCTAAVLTELSTWAPVHAVLGNNDGPDVADWGAPEELTVTLDGLAVAMCHDSGTAVGRAARLRRRFPGANLVVFGHSHIPLDEIHRDAAGREQQIFNPGSPTDRRRQAHGTMGIIDIERGRVAAARIIAVT